MLLELELPYQNVNRNKVEKQLLMSPIKLNLKGLDRYFHLTCTLQIAGYMAVEKAFISMLYSFLLQRKFCYQSFT